MAANYECECPHCGVKIDVYQAWTANDHAVVFRVVCKQCRGTIQCDVEMMPIFRVGLPKCQMCHHRTVPDGRNYCDDCQAELSARKAAAP